MSIRRRDITVMLLGSIKFLSYRKKVKKELKKMGFKVVIMEEYKGSLRNLDYGGIDEKFESMVRRFNPKMFVAIFHKGPPVDGVVFEIGWLCGRFRTKSIGKKLRFMFQEGYDFKKEHTTAYVKALFNKIPRVEFDESKPHLKSSELIRTFLTI